jgi:hypothetical protein
MATVGQTQTLPKDWDRIDCSKQHGRPWANVIITAYRFSCAPGGSIRLSVKGAHELCQDYCYKWRIVKGAGQLSDLYGKKVTYYAPTEQPECKDNPIIQLEYCGEVMDRVYIGISKLTTDDIAYFSAGPWRQGSFPEDNSCQPYTVIPHQWVDGEYFESVGKPGVIYQSAAWCGDKSILKACITIRRHSCDGRAISKEVIGLRQCCASKGNGVYVVIKDKFQAKSPWGFKSGAFGILEKTTYAAAKQDLLDAWLLGQRATDFKTIKELFPPDWYPGDPLPEGVTLDKAGEFPKEWYSGDAVPQNLKLKEGTKFPPGWTAGDPLPEGVKVEEDAWFPPGWTPTDPLPEGITLEADAFFPENWTAGDKLPEGASFPKGEYFDKGWKAGDEMPEGVTIAEGASFPPGWYSGDPLPEGVTLDEGAQIPFDWQPGDDPPEGLNLPPIWPEGRPKWWELRWTESLLKERGIVDVRPPKLIQEDCCVPEEEWLPPSEEPLI